MNRIFNRIFIAIFSLATLGGCTPEQSQYQEPFEKISIAAYAGDSAALVYIAENQEYFKNNGLDITIKDFEAGKLATDAMLAGEADISTATDFVFVSQSFHNRDLRTFGVIATAQTNEQIARKDTGIKIMTDLKGKKNGITQKSSGEFCLGRFLTFAGLSFFDVEVIDLKPSDLVEAILNGSADAVLTWEPNIYNIKKIR